jgi:Holliday junction resolvase
MTAKKPLKETGPNGIEAKTKKYARKLGCVVRKFSSPSQRSVPDDIFVTPTGVVFFIEFKSPNKKPSPAQEREINKLLKNKGIVYVVDNLHEEGVSNWKKDGEFIIEIWHDGYALIDELMLC